MNKTWKCALMATLLAWAPLSHGAGNTTTANMEVSFRIVESCAIQSDADADRATHVSCVHGTPYELVRKSSNSSQATLATSATAAHVDASTADQQDRVLTVAF